MKRKKKPNITKNDVVMTPLPTLNRRSAKNRSGSIGCAVRRSHPTKPTRKTTAVAKLPRMRASVQPRAGPR